MKKYILGLFCALLLINFNTALANTPSVFTENETYFKIENGRRLTENKGKIEVLAFLWYGCGGCFLVEPKLLEWERSVPENVNLQIVPALLGGIWDIHGKMMLTLQEMKVDPSIHAKIFEAIQIKRVRLTNMNEIKPFIQSLDIDSDKFASIYSSFALDLKVQNIKSVIKSYNLKAVPAVVIDAKYRFDISNVADIDQFLEQLDYLIDKQSN